MRVSELIDLLGNFDPDMEVAFGYPSGDYWHSQLAQTPFDAEIRGVVYSDYHSRDKVVSDNEDNAGEYDKKVVLLT